MPTHLTLLRGLLPRTTPAGSSLVTTIEHAATPAEIMDAGLPLGRLEHAFRSPHLGCVVVHDAGDGRIGLVTRARYFSAVAGDLGFGRALLARARVADVVDWSPLVLDRTVGVVEAALAITARSEDHRYDPVLVRSAEWRVAAPADVVRALTALLAASALQDEVTGLPNGAHLELDVAERLARTEGTPHRVALLVLRLDGLDRLRATEGDGAADALAVRTASHLRAVAPAGWDVCRTGESEFAVLGTLPGPLAPAAAAAHLDPLQTAIVGSYQPGRTGDVAVRLRSVAVCSVPGAGDPAELVGTARRRLAGAVPSPRLESVGS